MASGIDGTTIAKRIEKDPFRLFFPLGWAFALIGLAPWLPFAWTDQTPYPGGFHAALMSRGFLSCFILGFLMTAIPRFTETATARSWEVALGLTSVIACPILALVGGLTYARALTLFQILVLAVFIARRFPQRRSNPPGAFVFVAIGLLLGFVGSSLEFLALFEFESVSLAPSIILFGRLTSFYGMVLALILGVGSRLFPGILGWTEIVHAQRQQYEKPVSFIKAIPTDLVVGAVILVASFLLETFAHEGAGRGLRAALITYIAIRYWRLHRRPPKSTWMNWALMAAALNIVLGEWFSFLFPDWGLDGKHLVFVGGFSLLSLLVGARVTLAHGEGLSLESRWWPYLPLTLFILMASMARTGVHWAPGSYFPHLAYAALLWLLGAGVWALAFLPRLLKGLFQPSPK